MEDLDFKEDNKGRNSSSDTDGNSSESDSSSSDNEVASDIFCSNLSFAESNEEDADNSEESSSDDEDEYDDPVFVAGPPTVLEEPINITKMDDNNKSSCYGYRLCGDNIDKTVRARYMRKEKRNSSLHYFHSYAVQNRIDTSLLSDVPPDDASSTTQDVAKSILPSHDDDVVLKNNIAVLVSRVLVQYIDFLKFSFDGVVDWHIKHQYYEEMSSKSCVVRISQYFILYIFMHISN